MEKLKLIRPTIEYKEQVLDTVQEFEDNNSNIYWISWLKKYLDNYEWWLEYLEKNEHKETVAEWYVPWIQYISIREGDDRLVWFINTRLELNEALLLHWGHIGYAIRPSERKKNYATAQLFSVLDLFDNLWVEKVLLTCNKENIWSAKTIQKCGWILENEVIDPTDWELLQRYWINVKEGIDFGKDFFEDTWIDIKIQ